MIVTGSAIWEGSFREGSGSISTTSDTLNEVPYTYLSRFEGSTGANPEELLAAAHAACFNHALANISGLEGTRTETVTTFADVTMGRDSRGPAILNIRLRTTARVPGVDATQFQSLAHRAKEGCALSKALAGVEIDLEATLVD